MTGGSVGYDMRQSVEHLIDETLPDLSIPDSIVKTYLIETLAQPGGKEMLSTLVSPLVGKTVGTALVEFRRQRWTAATSPGGTFLPFLRSHGVDLHAPDRFGDTAFFQAWLHEVVGVSLPGSSPGPTDGLVHSKAAFRELFDEDGVDPLLVSPSGQSFLHVQGQGLTAPHCGLPILKAAIEKALAEVSDPVARWQAIERMEAAGVAPALQAWWKATRAPHQAAFLAVRWEPSAPERPRPRF